MAGPDRERELLAALRPDAEPDVARYFMEFTQDELDSLTDHIQNEVCQSNRSVTRPVIVRPQ